MGVSFWPPFRIPNTSPSQARFNHDEPKLRLMQTDSPKASPSCIGIVPSLFSGVILRLQRVWVSLDLFLGKVLPSTSNAQWPKPLVSFECDAVVSVGMRFLGYFPWKCVTLTFEHLVAETLG
jgi:hypothetical protein